MAEFNSASSPTSAVRNSKNKLVACKGTLLYSDVRRHKSNTHKTPALFKSKGPLVSGLLLKSYFHTCKLTPVPYNQSEGQVQVFLDVPFITRDSNISRGQSHVLRQAPTCVESMSVQSMSVARCVSHHTTFGTPTHTSMNLLSTDWV